MCKDAKVVELWAYWSQSVCRWPQGQTSRVRFGHLSPIATLESATAKRLLIISGAHCLHKELWLPILPICFLGTCFLTFLAMLSAVWLVWDFASTPSALKPQLEILPFSLLATYVRLMIMSRMKSMFSFTARTLRWFLSAGSTAGSYFHRQDRRSFYTRKTTLIFFIHELIWLYEQASSYTSWLKAFFLVIFFLVILQTHLVTGFFSKLPLRCPPEAYIAM